MQQRILLIDDNAALAELLRSSLKSHHYEAVVAHDGIAGLNEARRTKPNLILLGVTLPGMDGLEVCRRLRDSRETRLIPIIMISEQSHEEERVTGLELGADDYLSEPFSTRELLARIKTILRRHSSQAVEGIARVSLGDLEIDVSRHSVRVRDVRVHLTYTEFMILHCLAQHPGRVFSRDELLTYLGGENCFIQEHNLDVHIHAVRKKIEQDPARPKYIQTVRGVGYRIKDHSISKMIVVG